MTRPPHPIQGTPITTNQQPWTTRKLLRWMLDHLKAKGVDSPRLTSEMLLSHVLGCDRVRLYMEADRVASAEELKQLRNLVRRAAEHEPVQYLVGEGWFYSRAFFVDSTTLIPRPSTESLVDAVLEHARACSPPEVGETSDELHILDLCTGSGCIAITLALNLPQASIIATDIVPEALKLARKNALRHGVADRIEFREGDLFEAARNESFDVICSNPPYVSDKEWDEIDRNVQDYEPATALRGGPEGLDIIQPLLEQSVQFLNPGGLLAVEIAHAQRDAVLDLVQCPGSWIDPEVIKDHEEYWRILTAHSPR